VLAGGEGGTVCLAGRHRRVAYGVNGNNGGAFFTGVLGGFGSNGNHAWGEGGYKAGAADGGESGVAAAPGYALRRAGGGDGSGELLGIAGADQGAVGAHGHAGGCGDGVVVNNESRLVGRGVGRVEHAHLCRRFV